MRSILLLTLLHRHVLGHRQVGLGEDLLVLYVGLQSMAKSAKVYGVTMLENAAPSASMAAPYLDVMLLPEKKLVCHCRELMAEKLLLLLLDKERNPAFASLGSGAEDVMLLSLHLTRGDIHSHRVHVGRHINVLLCMRARARG